MVGSEGGEGEGGGGGGEGGGGTPRQAKAYVTLHRSIMLLHLKRMLTVVGENTGPPQLPSVRVKSDHESSSEANRCISTLSLPKS